MNPDSVGDVREGDRHRIHFVIHTGGVEYGGAPQRAPDGERIIGYYVGNGSEFDFHDPDSRRGGEIDPVTGHLNDRKCTGHNGFLQRAMVDASGRVAGAVGSARSSEDWLARRVTSPKEPLWRLAQKILGMIKLGILLALRRYDRGDVPWADLSFDCQKGRHRSIFAADLAGGYLASYGFPVAYAYHHARVMPGLDDRGLCGCQRARCRMQAGRNAGPRS